MTHIQFHDIRTGPPPLGPGREIDTSAIEVFIPEGVDKSDPNNELCVVAFCVGHLRGRVQVARGASVDPLREAIAALLIGVSENAAEFRNALAANGSD